MRRPLRPDEHRLWSLVAATVHPLPGRADPRGRADAETQAAHLEAASPPDPAAPPLRLTSGSGQGHSAAPRGGFKALEPARLRRIARERDPLGAHIDLHGLTQDAARAALERFVLDCWRDGLRSVLVITGKGLRGDGVLRRRTPEWLAAPHLSAAVAGISEAHRRHGGEGALYIALKRRPPLATGAPRQ